MVPDTPRQRPARLVGRVARRVWVCRCGTRINRGGQVLKVTEHAQLLTDLFSDRAFCSLVCLGAFVRETLDQLDGLGTEEAAAIARTLRMTYAQVVHEQYALLGRWYGDWVGVSDGSP